MRFQLSTITAMAASFGMAQAFSASANDNVVLYWGQNSAGTQKSLGSYCQSTDADMYVISFLTDFPKTGMNIVGCNDFFPGTNILNCPNLAGDIKTCQGLGKKVLISLGGAVGTYGFTSDSQAEDYADTLWNLFGGGTSSTRPFGDAVIDGFDLDIENNNNVGYAALTNKLRQNFAGGNYYITGAPQCVYPDASLGDALEHGYFDFVFVQFYNNPCGVDKAGFNWNTWRDYAASSRNPNVKIYLGIPGSSSAAGSGYTLPGGIETIVSKIKGDSCFGGIMMWDASQAFSNMIQGTSYCAAMKNALGGDSSPAPQQPESQPASSSPRTTAAPTTAANSPQPTTLAVVTSSSAAQQTDASKPTSAPASQQPQNAGNVVYTTVIVGGNKLDGQKNQQVETSPSDDSDSAAEVTSAPGSSVEPVTTSTVVSVVDTTSIVGTSTVTVATAKPSASAPAPAAPAAGSGSGSVLNPDEIDGVCAGKAGALLSGCLNKQFSENKTVQIKKEDPVAQPQDDSTLSENCTEGEVTCYQGKFAMCNFNKWVMFDCAPTTMCSATNLDGKSVVVGCNYISVVLAEEAAAKAAEASATAAHKMFKRSLGIEGTGTGFHRHHVHVRR